MERATRRELINLNVYWLGLAFMWNSLHVLVLPAVLLNFVPDATKNTVLGLLTFVGLLIATLVQPLSGALSDNLSTRFGRRRPLMGLGILLDLFFLGGMALAGGLAWLALAYFGLQIASNIGHGPAQGLMHDRVPRAQMGTASGVKNLFDMGGAVLAALITGRVLVPSRPGIAYLAIALLLVGSASITLFGSHEDPPAQSPPRQTLREQFSLDIRAHAAFWRLILARGVFLVGVLAVQGFAEYFVKDVLGAKDPVQLTGNLLASIVLSIMAFALIAGRLSDRIGRKPMHAVASILTASGSLLLLSARSTPAVLGFGVIVGAGIGVFLTANWALANDLAPRGEGGKFLGLTNLATAGAGAISRLAGPGIDLLNAARPGAYLGYAGLFAGAAILALVSLIILRSVPDPAKGHPGT